MANVKQAIATGQQERENIIVPIFSSMLFGFGATLLLISAAYVRDLETLQRVPEAIWLFVCGVPTSDPMTLPLMLGFSVVALIAGSVLIVGNRSMPSIRERLKLPKRSND